MDPFFAYSGTYYYEIQYTGCDQTKILGSDFFGAAPATPPASAARRTASDAPAAAGVVRAWSVLGAECSVLQMSRASNVEGVNCY